MKTISTRNLKKMDSKANMGDDLKYMVSAIQFMITDIFFHTYSKASVTTS